MSSGTPFEPQEIAITRITFPDQNTEKKRPVLIISKFSKKSTEDIFVCLPITSSLSDDPFGIRINAADMQNGILPLPSQVLCQYYFTKLKIDKEKRVGKVTPQFYQKLKTKIHSDILDV